MERLNRPGPNAREEEVEAYLHQLCSDVTLYDPKLGFFRQFLDQIDHHVSKDFVTRFGKLKTDEERILEAWKVKPIHCLQVQSFYKKKDRDGSEKRRAEGNKAFQEKKNYQALVFYSQAIMKAPEDEGSVLALGYANRSAVLYHLGEHRLCLTDVDMAINTGYPSNLRFKILDRRGQCLAKLGQYSQAAEAFRSAVQSLSASSLDAEKMALWNKDLDAKICNCEGKTDKEDPREEKQSKVSLYNGPNPALPTASSSVGLKVTQEAGRFAVANTDIPAGSVLFSERPYCGVLMENMKGVHCAYCFKKLMAPIPCPQCWGVAFCSVGCRDVALATFHRWECRFLDLFLGSGMSLNCYLALKVITQHGLQFFKNIRSQLKESTTLPSASDPYRPSAYQSFYNLVRLEDQRKPSDFVARSLMCCFLLKALQQANFFGRWDPESPPDSPLTDDEVLIGRLLLRNLQVIQFNAHEISGISYKKEGDFRNTKSAFIGMAVYPTVSFCNHSCYPAVGRYFEGDRMAIVALRPLKPGDALAENYGPIFTHKDRQERQRKLLSRYWFRCKCEACEEDWPVYDCMGFRRILLCQSCRSELPSRTQQQSNVNCSICGTSHNVVAINKKIDEMENIYKEGKKQMDDGRREEAISHFFKYVEEITRLVKPPFRELHLALQGLRLLVAARGTIHTLPPTPPQKK